MKKQITRKTFITTAIVGSILLMAAASAAYLLICGYNAEKTEVIAALLLWRIGECAEEAILQSMWHAGADIALDGSRIPCLRDYLKEASL